MSATVDGIHLGPDTHANRPAATAVESGTLYSCSDHNLIYRSNGATWTTWATLGSAGGGGYDEVSSFPAAVAGDKVYHTGYDMIFKYDGTRWLCTCLHEEAPGSTGALVPNTAASAALGRWALTGNAIYLEQLYFGVYVAAPNGATHHWDLVLASVNGVTSTSLDTTDTSALAADTYQRVERTINAVVATTEDLIDWNASKGGTSPGAIFWAPKLQYRIIGV